MKTTKQVLGCDLKPGDVIIPWFENTAIITALKPYKGPLAYLWPKGAQIASFAPGSAHVSRGMTIVNDDYYKVVEQ